MSCPCPPPLGRVAATRRSEEPFEALREMHRWSIALKEEGRFGESEQLILQTTSGQIERDSAGSIIL